MDRWDALFADLEARLEVIEGLATAAETDDRTRGEAAHLRLVDRLRGALDQPVRVGVLGDLTVHGRLRRVGTDWLLVEETGRREALVPVAAVVGVRGASRAAATPGSEGQVVARLGLRSALRAVVRDRAVVRVHLTTGGTVDGTPDRVGADHLEVARHAPGEWRRRDAVTDVELIPLAVLAAVRRDAP